MSAAPLPAPLPVPLPMLGLAIDSVAAVEEKRLRRVGRFALNLAIAGVVLTVLAVGLWVDVSIEVFYFPQHPHPLLALRPLGLICPLMLLASLGAGVSARRTRSGKAAIIVALLPFAACLALLLAATK